MQERVRHPAMYISLVVAVAENGIIGRNGQIPWRLPSDLNMFRRLTMGKPVIMGRKTFQSIGRPLDGRANIVVTRNPAFRADGVETVKSIDVGIVRARELAAAADVSEIMIIGGAEIYRAALPHSNRIYLTRVHGQPDGDTTFTPPSGDGWHQASSAPLSRSDRDEYACTLVVLERPMEAEPP